MSHFPVRERSQARRAAFNSSVIRDARVVAMKVATSTIKHPYTP